MKSNGTLTSDGVRIDERFYQFEMFPIMKALVQGEHAQPRARFPLAFYESTWVLLKRN